MGSPPLQARTGDIPSVHEIWHLARLCRKGGRGRLAVVERISASRHGDFRTAMSDFSFSPAVREKTPMILALAGASGSGKTYSALELASGLAGDGKIAFIDTEGRRGLHYADQFKFDYCELRSPYEPASFLRAWKAAEAAGYTVIVTDSYSDEYIGEGGLVDMAAKEIDRVK